MEDMRKSYRNALIICSLVFMFLIGYMGISIYRLCGWPTVMAYVTGKDDMGASGGGMDDGTYATLEYSYEGEHYNVRVNSNFGLYKKGGYSPIHINPANPEQVENIDTPIICGIATLTDAGINAILIKKLKSENE